MIRSKKYYIVLELENNNVLGVFGNLKSACQSIKGKNYYSYWTLAREQFQRKDKNGYSIQVAYH